MGVSPISRATSPSTFFSTKITNTKVALVFAAFLVTVYALYSARHYFFPPTLRRKPPVTPRTFRNLPPSSSPEPTTPMRASDRKTVTAPHTPISPKKPASPVLTPNRLFHHYLNLYLTKNSWTLAEKPLVNLVNGDEFVLTEERMVLLENYFASYDPQKQFGELDVNPYAFCAVLQNNPHSYEHRAPKDKQRIETLVANYEAAKIASTFSEENPFIFIYPVTYGMIQQINQFLDNFLAVPEENLIYWMSNFYEGKNDPLYWCYYLVKMAPQFEKNDLLDELIGKYQKARDIIFKTPELSSYFCMDSFTLVDGTEINGEVLLTIQRLLSALGERDAGRRQTAIQECLRGTGSDHYQAALLKLVDICEAFAQNPDAYHDCLPSDKELLNALVKDYLQLRTRIGRKNDPLLTFIKIYAEVKRDPILSEMVQKAQTENCRRFFDEEEVLSNFLTHSAAYFKSLTDLPSDDEARTWIQNECQKKTGYFFEVFRFLNAPYHYPFTEELTASMPEILKAYLAAVQKVVALASETSRDALLYEKIESFLDNDLLSF